VAIAQVTIVLGGNCTLTIVPGGNCPGDSSPRIIAFCQNLVFSSSPGKVI